MHPFDHPRPQLAPPLLPPRALVLLLALAAAAIVVVIAALRLFRLFLPLLLLLFLLLLLPIPVIPLLRRRRAVPMKARRSLLRTLLVDPPVRLPRARGAAYPSAAILSRASWCGQWRGAS